MICLGLLEENGFWVRQDQTYSETGKKGSVFPFFEFGGFKFFGRY